MTREHKISLIVGFALVLLVAVAVSDHLSNARSATLETDMLTADAGWSASPASLPASTPIDVYAPAPAPVRVAETPRSTDQPRPGPIERGLAAANESKESTPNRAADFLDRLRNRFEAMPLALEIDRAQPIQQSPPAAPTTTPNTTPASAQTTSPLPTADIPVVWHSVEEGDSLWSIAQRHYGDGSLAGRLAEFNGSRAANPDIIRVGVRLRIPPKAVLAGAAQDTTPAAAPANQPNTKPAAKPAPTAAPTEYRLYKIKPGDTLGAIAMRELGTIRRAPEIVAMNPRTLADPDIVPVGVTIRLPAK